MGRLKTKVVIIIVVLSFIVTTLVVTASGGSEPEEIGAFFDYLSPPYGPEKIPAGTLDDIRPSQTLTSTGTFTTGTYVTAPGDLPIFTVEAADNGIADGYIFITYFNYYSSSPVQPYQLILDNEGQPIYFNRIGTTFDFKVQPNGNITYFDSTGGVRRYLEVNNQYQIINSYQAGNDYDTDNHDLQLLDNGNWLILSDDARIIDMSVIVPGGDPNAVVVGCVVQEIDTAGNVVFEWNSFDHVPITDSYSDLTASLFRYVHCNSIESDFDGNLLMSSRHLQQVIKIDRQTGEIMWRLGGMQNDFTFTNDPGFYYQHDARRLPNGNLTLFDNRTAVSPVYSRAVEYAIDEQNFTATRVRVYRRTPDAYGPFMGNFRYLPNGNRLIGWGGSSIPILTEVNDADEIVFELSTAFPNGSYRAFRFPWEGHPTWSPFLIARQEGPDVKLYFSWNGSTDVVEYFIYGNAGFNPVNLLAVVPKDGFEASYEFTPPTNELYSFRVQARGAGSIPLDYSNISYVGGESVFMPLFTKNGN